MVAADNSSFRFPTHPLYNAAVQTTPTSHQHLFSLALSYTYNIPHSETVKIADFVMSATNPDLALLDVAVERALRTFACTYGIRHDEAYAALYNNYVLSMLEYV